MASASMVPNLEADTLCSPLWQLEKDVDNYDAHGIEQREDDDTHHAVVIVVEEYWLGFPSSRSRICFCPCACAA